MVGAMRLPAGKHSLLVPFDAVRASVPRPGLTSVPGSPAWLIGAWNHHGQAIAVVDVCALCALPDGAVDGGWIVLVEGTRGLVGLLTTGPATELTAEPPPTRDRLLTPMGGDLWVDLDRVCEAMDRALAGAG